MFHRPHCHSSTLVLAFCKANHWSYGRKGRLCTAAECPPFNRHQPKFPQLVKSTTVPNLVQIASSSLHYMGVKYNTCVRFSGTFSILSFPSLSFPFSFLPSSTAWTPEPIFMVDNSKCVDCCKKVPLYVWTMSDHFWGVVSSKNYHKKATDAEKPAKWMQSKNL